MHHIFRSVRGGVLLPVLLVLTATPAAAHQRLRHSSPADGDQLDAVPRELRLTFAQRVDVALLRVELFGPDGSPVALTAPVLVPDSANVVAIAIDGPLAAGSYTVQWRVVGADGHPVTGRFGFTIAEGAAGLAASPSVGSPGDEPVPGHEGGAAGPPGSPAEATTAAPGFGVESPMYVAIRWLTFLCLVGLIGSVAFRLSILPRAVRGGGAAAESLAAPAAARARAMALACALVLLPTAILRLLAQAYALGPLDGAVLAGLIGSGAWGLGWTMQTTAAAIAIVGLRLSARRETAGWAIATAAAVVLAITSALSGHAAASPAVLPVAADALHVIGAGGWIGGLAALVGAGIPAARSLGDDRKGAAIAALVNAFSPAALVFAGTLAATGLYATWLHVGGIAALVGSAYGRTLLLKLAALAVVAGTGAYNFLRVRPALGDGAGIGRIRRMSWVELVAGAVVLAVTAVLVATPPPALSPGAMAGEAAAQAVANPEP